MKQCVRSSNCVDNLFIIYLFLKRNPISRRNYAGTLDVSFDTFNNAISLVLRDSDTDSENVSQRSGSNGQKTWSSKSVSLIGK